MLSAYTIHLDRAFGSRKLIVQVDDNHDERVHILDEEYTTTKKAMKAVNDLIADRLQIYRESIPVGQGSNPCGPANLKSILNYVKCNYKFP